MSGAIGSTSGRPPRFLADENLEKAIVVGLRQKRPDMTIVTTHQAGVAGLKDPQLLQRAKELDLILSTHDRKTMYDHFADFLMRLPAGEYSPGVMLVSQDKYSIGQIIGFLLDVYDLSQHEEWRNLPTSLPL